MSLSIPGQHVPEQLPHAAFSQVEAADTELQAAQHALSEGSFNESAAWAGPGRVVRPEELQQAEALLADAKVRSAQGATAQQYSTCSRCGARVEQIKVWNTSRKIAKGAQGISDLI